MDKQMVYHSIMKELNQRSFCFKVLEKMEYSVLKTIYFPISKEQEKTIGLLKYVVKSFTIEKIEKRSTLINV